MVIPRKTFRLIKRIYKYTVNNIFCKLSFFNILENEDKNHIVYGYTNERYELRTLNSNISLNKI